MRISDWSSDVCSSDLGIIDLRVEEALRPAVTLRFSFLIEAGPGSRAGLARLGEAAVGRIFEGIEIHRQRPATALIDRRPRRLSRRHAVGAVRRTPVRAAIARCCAIAPDRKSAV